VAFNERGKWTNGTVDERGRRVFSNGLTERGFKVFGLVVGGRTQIATMKLQSASGTLVLPIYQFLSTDALRIQTSHGLGAFSLVDISDPKASPLRVKASSGIKAIKKL
jgi:hypothetical protein